mmetsp:Transcript_2190/g.5440  ORF Transcript_2190/g.5440 Transcript_2190/m.5440 type:complete len:263 (-) Transcript_2190:255-1043(-)
MTTMTTTTTKPSAVGKNPKPKRPTSRARLAKRKTRARPRARARTRTRHPHPQCRVHRDWNWNITKPRNKVTAAAAAVWEKATTPTLLPPVTTGITLMRITLPSFHRRLKVTFNSIPTNWPMEMFNTSARAVRNNFAAIDPPKTGTASVGGASRVVVVVVVPMRMVSSRNSILPNQRSRSKRPRRMSLSETNATCGCRPALYKKKKTKKPTKSRYKCLIWSNRPRPTTTTTTTTTKTTKWWPAPIRKSSICETIPTDDCRSKT